MVDNELFDLAVRIIVENQTDLYTLKLYPPVQFKVLVCDIVINRYLNEIKDLTKDDAISLIFGVIFISELLAIKNEEHLQFCAYMQTRCKEYNKEKSK